jgi:CubicO group peptidase (beta-lactamase class C family)
VTGVPSADFSGVALVQRQGSTVAAHVGGVADRREGKRCTRTTRFQLCSVSKQFTAAAVLLLADGGQLTTDDPIRRWFGGCPADWQAITVHHLLTHTAGLGHWHEYAGLDLTKAMPQPQQLEVFWRTPLFNRPGSRWRYSSPGYVLLGWIVQQTVGQPYADFLADHIFVPLGLESSSVGDREPGGGTACGHRDGQPVRSWNLGSANLGTGDVWTTADDLLRWDDALVAGEVLSDAARLAMFTAHTTVDDDGLIRAEGYGYGWYVGTAAGHRAYFHQGDNPGFLAFNAWLPDDRVQVAVLINDEAFALGPFAGELIRDAIGSV